MMFDVLHLDHEMTGPGGMELILLVIELCSYALRPPQRAMCDFMVRPILLCTNENNTGTNGESLERGKIRTERNGILRNHKNKM